MFALLRHTHRFAHVIAFDAPGQGASDPVPGCVDTDTAQHMLVASKLLAIDGASADSVALSSCSHALHKATTMSREEHLQHFPEDQEALAVASLVAALEKTPFAPPSKGLTADQGSHSLARLLNAAGVSGDIIMVAGKVRAEMQS